MDGFALPVPDAVARVLDGVKALELHPDVPEGLRVLADAGARVVPLTNRSLARTEGLLERPRVDGLVERRMSVDGAGRWRPHPDAHQFAAEQGGVPLERCAMVAVHPWDLHGAAAVGLTTGFVGRRGTPWSGVSSPPDFSGTTVAEVARGLVSR